MTLNHQKQIEQFAKLAVTMLGRCPHEFGLVPDADGFVKIKEFLQAVIETAEWRHIRMAHVNDMMLMMGDPPVEINQTRIRAKNRPPALITIPCEAPPKLLYVCVKQKSYPTVLADGIRPSFHDHVICCEDPEMAKRIGERRDPHPVLLTVHVGMMKDRELALYQAGEGLYLTKMVPAECFTGPPPPKNLPETKRIEKKSDAVEAYKRQAQKGTFFLDLFSTLTPSGKTQKKEHGEKHSGWKHNKKRLRKEKKQFWPPYD